MWEPAMQAADPSWVAARRAEMACTTLSSTQPRGPRGALPPHRDELNEDSDREVLRAVGVDSEGAPPSSCVHGSLAERPLRRHVELQNAQSCHM
mmetsp:Transcript_60296/g.169041  ORF Transcript_60296/g.169041 Transcript_60296/m.169041 type:complete len:94 (-) Transcript_60296:99-380(-)